MSDSINLYFDGGNISNGQPESLGAWAYCLMYRDDYFEDSGIVLQATNNICEMTALLMGLRKIKNNKIPLVVYGDSQYVLNGLQFYVPKWKQNGWKTSDKRDVKNKELWIELDTVKQVFYDIKFEWVKGHSGNQFNERVDQLCVETRNKYLAEQKQTNRIYEFDKMYGYDMK